MTEEGVCGPAVALISDPSFQNCKEINICCFNPSVVIIC